MSILISSVQRIVEEMNREYGREMKYVMKSVLDNEDLSNQHTDGICRAALEEMFFDELRLMKTDIPLISDKKLISMFKTLMTEEFMTKLHEEGAKAKIALQKKSAARKAKEEADRKASYDLHS